MIKPEHVSYGTWFAYADYEQHTQRNSSTVITHDFTYAAEGDQEALGWEREEWKVSAVIVPVDSPEERASLETALASGYIVVDERFRPSWQDELTIDFASTRSAYGITYEPWIFDWNQPNTGTLIIVPRQDFMLYHGLEPRQTMTGADYYQPTEQANVMQIRRKAVAFYNELPFCEVHRDYLRDYLSARRAALLLDIVADRFANADTLDPLSVSNDDRRIGDSAWIQSTAYRDQQTGVCRGRSSLYCNVLIEPYERPKPSRSIWPFFGHVPLIDEEQPNAPLFKRGAEGVLERAREANLLTYYYFKPQVLQKYLDDPAYRVFFHMRNWGAAVSPSGAIDVGINSKGLVNGYALDIARLREREQLHWASYSVNADGEVCREMFQTRMQNDPPSSPNVLEIIIAGRQAVSNAFQNEFGRVVFREREPSEREQMRLTVGPIALTGRDVPALAQILYDWAIDTLDFDVLRDILNENDVAYDPAERQISLLKRVLLLRVGDAVAAESHIAPLRLMTRLRVQAAHTTGNGVQEELASHGILIDPFSDRSAYEAIVDALGISLTQVARAISGA